jgi:hypothetical protein
MATKDYKKEYEKIFTDKIKREGADKLLEYLQGTDFFTAPASTKFHSNHAGGLVEHCVKVYHRFVKTLEFEFGADYFKKNPEMVESAAVIALLHDMCKIGCYRVDERNVKVGNEWVKKPYYAYDDPLPYGHGEKSVYMISGFIRLSREEAMAINWHMGAYDARNNPGSWTLSDAFQKYPIALLFHVADNLASYLDETVTK